MSEVQSITVFILVYSNINQYQTDNLWVTCYKKKKKDKMKLKKKRKKKKKHTHTHSDRQTEVKI